VKYDAESTVLHDSVRGFYPDLRKAINELQKGSSTGTLSVNNQFANQEFIAKLFQLVQQKQVLKVRKFVIEQEAAFNGDYPVLLRELFNVIDSLDLPDSQKRDCLLLVSEYMYRSAFVLDQEINFYSCLVGLSKVI
jgi:replication factor C small subunit